MNIQTQMKLTLMQAFNSYDKLGADLKIYVSTQKSLGVSSLNIQEQLLKDLKNRTGVFREVFSALKNERLGSYNTAGVVASNQFLKNDLLKYKWLLDPDAKKHCIDCLNNEEMGAKDYSYWEAIGLPATGHTECGQGCKCTLSPI